MKRRGLLTGLGMAVTAAGCVGPGGFPESGTPTESTAPGDTGTPTDSGTPGDTGTSTDSGTPGDTGTSTDTAPEIPDASNAFAGDVCPSYTATERTVCYHTATESDDVVLAADPEVFDPEGGDSAVEALRFTLYNRSEWTVHLNPYGWGIHRRDGSSWSRVAPDGLIADPMYLLEPGRSLHWELPEMTHPSPGGSDTYRVDTALKTGTYAFSVTGRYELPSDTGSPTAEPPAETTFLALFRLVSPVGTATETATVDG